MLRLNTKPFLRDTCVLCEECEGILEEHLVRDIAMIVLSYLELRGLECDLINVRTMWEVDTRLRVVWYTPHHYDWQGYHSKDITDQHEEAVLCIEVVEPSACLLVDSTRDILIRRKNVTFENYDAIVPLINDM